ncbi:YqzE family protein [Paenibacillus rubinfantis]|uniref:YqzE family protein n=1 Tax=Paenibacillus rubinfantis TaxID=1720296 RepID=UPI00073EB235|nr:YqzE family protein [Paenibacillus rubinfantis]
MAKGDELVKYITERVVDYVEMPREVRRERSKVKEPWTRRWFGMIPFSLSLWAGQLPKPKKKEARRKEHTPHSREV